MFPNFHSMVFNKLSISLKLDKKWMALLIHKWVHWFIVTMMSPCWVHATTPVVAISISGTWWLPIPYASTKQPVLVMLQASDRIMVIGSLLDQYPHFLVWAQVLADIAMELVDPVFWFWKTTAGVMPNVFVVHSHWICVIVDIKQCLLLFRYFSMLWIVQCPCNRLQQGQKRSIDVVLQWYKRCPCNVGKVGCRHYKREEHPHSRTAVSEFHLASLLDKSHWRQLDMANTMMNMIFMHNAMKKVHHMAIKFWFIIQATNMFRYTLSSLANWLQKDSVDIPLGLWAGIGCVVGWWMLCLVCLFLQEGKQLFVFVVVVTWFCVGIGVRFVLWCQFDLLHCKIPERQSKRGWCLGCWCNKWGWKEKWSWCWVSHMSPPIETICELGKLISPAYSSMKTFPALFTCSLRLWFLTIGLFSDGKNTCFQPSCAYSRPKSLNIPNLHDFSASNKPDCWACSIKLNSISQVDC